MRTGALDGMHWIASLSLCSLLAGCGSDSKGETNGGGSGGMSGAAGALGGAGAALDAGGAAGQNAVGGHAGSGGASGSDGAAGKPCSFAETFESFSPGVWGSGTFGAWSSVYIDTVGVESDGSKVLFEKPMASKSPGETHANLVVTEQGFAGDLDFRLRMKTVEQLRTGSTPNNWEVAWVFWSYLRPEQAYYFVPKPAGWELGKSDDTKADPSGSECDFPDYVNCLYPGAQRFLATGDAPSFPIGEWHTIRITQSQGAISVWMNGSLVTNFVDDVNVLEGGKIGLYNEDAHVRFDDVCVE